MNLFDIHNQDKPLQTQKIFGSIEGSVISIQLLENAELKEHITRTPASLLDKNGETVYEGENGNKALIGNSPNSVGFLIRYIGEVESLFAKNVFGDCSVKITAKTVIEKRGTGEWPYLEGLKNYVAESFEKLKSIVDKQPDEDWESTITTKEFGIKTKGEAFGRIVSHTAYPAGQLAIINKYGK